MTSVFADTSFYIGLLRRVDELHPRCIAFDGQYRGAFLTSEFVLIELGNWLAETAQRRVMGEFVRRLHSDPRTTILPADSAWTSLGLELYVSRRDKQWSFIDCISFQMMRQHGVTDALSADHHFTQAGFNALLIEGNQSPR